MKTHKNYEQIISQLTNLDDSKELETFILDLKRNEIFIDRRGGNKFKAIVSNVEPKNCLAKKYLNEVELINLIFVQEKILQDEILKIPAKYRFAYVWAGFNHRYFATGLKFFEQIQSRKYNRDDMLVAQGFVEVFIAAFKALTYQVDIYHDTTFTYLPYTCKLNVDWIDLTISYMNNAMLSLKWDNLYSAWKHGLVKVQIKDDIIYIRFVKNIDYNWLNKSLSKAEIYKRIEYCLNIVKIIALDKNIQFGSQEFLNLLSNHYINDLIHKYCNGSEMFSDIPVTDWIKAYTALHKYCKQWYNINYLKDFTYKKYKKNKKLFFNTKKYWLDVLVASGVSENNVDALFSKLIYTKNASDLLDYPFIQVKDKYLIAHNLMNDADLGLVLESRLKQSDVNMPERGKNFELLIINELKSKNIKAVRLHRKIENKEYECDVAFVIDEVLFLCECKDYGIKELVNWNYNFYDKDIKQANRIFEFFENDLDYVKQCFVNNKVVVKNINFIAKFLIYNSSLYGMKQINGIKVLDYDKFISPIRRSFLDKQICKRGNGPLECLGGQITAKKIFKYHKSIINILNFDNLAYTQESKIKFGSLNLVIDEHMFNAINEEQIMDIVLPLN